MRIFFNLNICPGRYQRPGCKQDRSWWILWILILSIAGSNFCYGGTMLDNVNKKKMTTWIVERDMPQSRNLVPILNRSILVAAGDGSTAEATYSVNWKLAGINVKKGPFWPVYGEKARMGVPIIVPEGFPCPEPGVLGEPVLEKKNGDVLLSWSANGLTPGQGFAVHSDIYLGPPDMFHTDSGLRFGDILVETEYQVKTVEPSQGDSNKTQTVTLECKLTLKNTGKYRVAALEFTYFFPRALLDNTTGEEIPILENFRFLVQGFMDSNPMDLLVSDGLARPAWGPRCVLRQEVLEPGEVISLFFQAEGERKVNAKEEVLIVPLVSLVARTPARYWPSAEIAITPPGKVEYSDYTHFNLVTADSRLFRLGKKGDPVQVETSSPVVLQYLGKGNE